MRQTGDDRLVSAAEIAERLGLRDGQVVLDLRRHHLGFPEPVARHSRALVWSWDHVETWAIDGADMFTGPIGEALKRGSECHTRGEP